MSEWDKINIKAPWRILATPDKKRVEGMPQSDNALNKKPQPRVPLSDTVFDAEGFSLADITPEEAESLLMLPLMQDTPPPAGGLGLADLKKALEKKRDGAALAPEESDALELAGEIVHSAMPPAEPTTGEALYHSEELAAHIEEFVRAALQYTVPRNPLLA